MTKKIMTMMLTLGALYGAPLPAAAAAAADDNVAVRTAIARLLPDARAAVIEPSELPGLTTVTIGMQVIYVSNDGGYFLGGPLIKTDTGVNLTEKHMSAARLRTLDQSSDVKKFRYAATESRHRITVFTDIDCPYCRRLHNDLPGYADAGIDVTYVMLPRAGKDSASYLKTVSAACAPSPEATITEAMNGSTIAPASCENPVDAHMALARAMNITSTPSIVLEDGRMILGHKKPRALLALIEAEVP